MSLATKDLDYSLPDELIARYPSQQRDLSRLLVVDRATGSLSHTRFVALPDYLSPGDCMVINRTRVRNARTLGRRKSGGRVEVLWIRPDKDSWHAMVRPGQRLKSGEVVELDSGDQVEIVQPGQEGEARVRLLSTEDPEALLNRIGTVPLPPYLKRDAEHDDTFRYQTVYARETGAVAAPTAGLHFTPELLDRLHDAGVARADLLLHVGPGTFRPVRTECVSDHKLDSEWFSISAEAHRTVVNARSMGHRVVAVGTTTVRALESAAVRAHRQGSCEGWTDLFIAPPFEFKVTDHLITNFHLPRSSLLALVAAFCGLDLTMQAYRLAVAERYRFYSYGDAMLIL
jgi:S-adenosylmethionine:tRNA ribosyltransferase-isomerase